MTIISPARVFSQQVKVQLGLFMARARIFSKVEEKMFLVF